MLLELMKEIMKNFFVAVFLADNSHPDSSHLDNTYPDNFYL